jgi:FRG1-like domain
MIAAAGLQCGFGAPLGAALLEQLRLIGFTIIRLDLQKVDDALTHSLAEEVITAGLQPLCIIRRAEQMHHLPEGALVELGNEPDLEHEHFPLDEYIEVAEECVEIAVANKRRLYLGAVSNLNPRGFRFLRAMPWAEYPPEICCSIHRYPDGDSPHNPHLPAKSREAEVMILKDIVGDRPLACTEVGYHDSPSGWSEAEVADNMAWERGFFSEQGFEIVSAYQVNDGPVEDPEPIAHFGFRRAGGSWKPVAFEFCNTLFPPLDGTTITLQSDHARYLTVQQNQTCVAKAEAANYWEHFQVERIAGASDYQVALRSWQWHYLTAELDETVNARAVAIGPWEIWTVEPLAEGRVGFRSAHGKYLTAELDGSLRARAERIGPWETWTSDPPGWWIDPPAITNPNLLVGDLHRDHRIVGDEGGVQMMVMGRRQAMSRPRILMFCHFMEAFSAWCHGRQADVESQCEVIAEHYAGIRSLDVLGYWDIAWRGKEVTPIAFVNHSGGLVPATPDYWEQKRSFLAMLHSLNLRVMDDRGDMNSWSLAQKLTHMRNNGQFYRGLPFGREVLAGVWSANEGWQNGGDSIDLCQQMLKAFAEGAGTLPALCGLSAPGGESNPLRLEACSPPMTSWEPEAPCSFVNWSAEPASVVTCHGNRGAWEHIIEHYFGYGYDQTIRQIGKPVFNTEPVGPGAGVSVGRVNDPELLCGLTMAALIGGQCWTYMSGFGVFWAGRIETQPGFAEVARLPQFLPQDIASWPTVTHSGTRFLGTRILAVDDPTRADQAISSDGRFAIVIHTQEAKGKALACERACADFTIVNMLTGEKERTGSLAVGERYQHPGIARLAVGRLA